MIKILKIIILIIFSLFLISSSCDKGAEGCTDSSLCDYNGDGVIDQYCACNYDDSFVIEDGSCQYPNDNKDCKGNCVAELDCFGVCGGTAETDCCGLCDSDNNNNPPEKNDGSCQDIITYYDENDELPEGRSVGDIKTGPVECGCMDPSKCNYNPNATNNNDSCAVDLSQFGGDINGNDCTYPLDHACGGTAVMDGCDLCIGGGITNYGECWKIEIKSIATFKLQDGTSMGSDTNSITIGTSQYALDGYNVGVSDNEDTDCISDYNDDPEPPNSSFLDKNNFIRFFTPHGDEDEWDDWGSKINLDIEPYFDRDIRANDYHSLFTEEKGMNWFAVIEPTLADTIIIDSLKFQITHLEGIKCSLINIYLDREKEEISGGIEYVVENNKLGIGIESDKEINIIINVSNICILEQDFDESCPDKN